MSFRAFIVLVSLALMALASCQCDPPPPPPDALPDGPVSWSRIAVGLDGAQIRARGFDGALPAGSEIWIFSAEQELARGLADERGRFDLSFDGDATAELELRVDIGEPESPLLRLAFVPKDMTQALRDAVSLRLAGTGSTPNDLAAVPALSSPEETPLLVVSSGDNLVDNLGFGGGQRLYPALVLPAVSTPSGAVTAQPFAVAVDGARAIVTHFGQSALTLFDVASGQVLGQIQERQTVLLPEPFAPAAAVDADGDGVDESFVDDLLPQAFQGLAVAAGRVFVAAANVLRTTPPVVYAPGMLMVYDIRERSLAPASTPSLWTQFDNPQQVIAVGDAVLVVETGVIEYSGGVWQTTSPGGVELYDASSLALLWRVDLGHSAPGNAVVSPRGDAIYVSSLLTPQLLKIDLSSGALLRGPDDPITLFEASSVQSVFGLSAHPAGWIFASSFNSDAVYVLDVADDLVSPWPFVEPFVLGDGGAAFAGAQDVVLRPGRNGVDFRGPDLAVLMSLAARIATIDTRHILGP